MKQQNQEKNHQTHHHHSNSTPNTSNNGSAESAFSSSSTESSSAPPSFSSSSIPNGKKTGAWSLFALIFKAACLLLACLTLSFSQFQRQKQTNKRRKRQTRSHNSESTANGSGSADSSPSLSPSCSSSSLACNCFTPSHCYCNTLYAVLRVPPNATPAQIRSSYRVLAKQLHPDKQGLSSDGRAFQQLQQSYEVLTNEEKRKAYDVSEGLLGWTSENMEEDQQTRRTKDEEARMEKIRKFDEDPLASALENLQKIQLQQQQREQRQQQQNRRSSPTVDGSASASASACGSSSPLSPNRCASRSPSSSSASASVSAADSGAPTSAPSFRRSAAQTPAAHRSLVLPILAHLSVIALLLLVMLSYPIKKFFSVILAQRRKFEWNTHNDANHIHSPLSTPITA